MRSVLRTDFFAACLCAITCAAVAETTGPTKVVITPDHVLSINGKKVFPIGLTLPPAPDAKTPTGKLAFEELRDAGVLLISTGPMVDVEQGKESRHGMPNGRNAKNNS